MKDASQKQKSYNPQTDVILGPTTKNTKTEGQKNLKVKILEIHQHFAKLSYFDTPNGQTTDEMAQKAFKHLKKKDFSFFQEDQSSQRLNEIEDSIVTNSLKQILDSTHKRMEKKAKEKQTNSNGKTDKTTADSDNQGINGSDTSKQPAYNPKKDIIFGQTTRYQGDDTALAVFHNDMVNIHKSYTKDGSYGASDGLTTTKMTEQAFKHFKEKNNMNFYVENPDNQKLELLDDKGAKKYFHETLDWLQSKVQSQAPQYTAAIQNGDKKRNGESQLQQYTPAPNKRQRTSSNGNSQSIDYSAYTSQSQSRFNPDKDLILGPSKLRQPDSPAERIFKKVINNVVLNSSEQDSSQKLAEASFAKFQNAGMNFFIEDQGNHSLIQVKDSFTKKQLGKIVQQAQKNLEKLKAEQVYTPSNDASINDEITKWANEHVSKSKTLSNLSRPSQTQGYGSTGANGYHATNHQQRVAQAPQTRKSSLGGLENNEDIVKWADDFIKSNNTPPQKKLDEKTQADDFLLDEFNTMISQSSNPHHQEQQLNLGDIDEQIKKWANPELKKDSSQNQGNRSFR